MPQRLWLIAASLAVFACGSARSTTASRTPASPPDFLFVGNGTDPALAACLADEIARIAERDANRQQLLEARIRAAEINARTSAEFADRAYARAATNNLRAQATAAETPTSQTARARASGADATAALAAARAAYTESQAAAASRAKEQMAGSARIAHRFAELAAAHSEIFYLRLNRREDRTTSSEEKELRALEVIDSIGELHPDLHWLYVDRFLNDFEVLPDRCL